MAHQSSVGSAHNHSQHEAKDPIEEKGGPLHFPADDELKPTDTMKQTILNAKAASDKEHQMSLWQGIRLYPKAIGWSVLISTCIAMEGIISTTGYFLTSKTLMAVLLRLRRLSGQQLLRV